MKSEKKKETKALSPSEKHLASVKAHVKDAKAVLKLARKELKKAKKAVKAARKQTKASGLGKVQPKPRVKNPSKKPVANELGRSS